MVQVFILIKIHIIHIGIKIFLTKQFHYLVHMLGEQMISMVNSSIRSCDLKEKFSLISDAFNWKNEWTNHTIQEEDIGAGGNHQYTSRYNRAYEWYSKWLPDLSRNDQGRGKITKKTEF
jgi:hypothetical protein